MIDLSRDPIINIIHQGIKRGIKVAIKNGCYGSAVILIYAGIDAMAYLNMPSNQEDVTRDDFVDWADRYIQFPCEEQLAGLDLYGARCGMLHNYSAFSRLTREDKCRNVGYVDKSVPEVIFNPKVSDSLVLVSLDALAAAFFKGIDQFLIDLFSNEEKAPVAEERLKKLVHSYPANLDKNQN